MGLIMDKERLLHELKVMGLRNNKILEAIAKTPRESFISKDQKNHAYDNHPLPIGYNQTISQPYTVAFMLELLNINKNDKVLEIGCGSGYNAAVMSYLVGDRGKIVSIEIIKELCDFAINNLEKAKINNVKLINSDGKKGYGKQAPYNKIVVTATASNIPGSLLEQLSDKGTIVLPVKRGFSEVMTKLVKKGKQMEKSTHGHFSFVPLV